MNPALVPVALTITGVMFALWRLSRVTAYTGRHRASRGQSHAQRAERSPSYLEARRYLNELTVPLAVVPAVELPAVEPATIGERQRYARLGPAPVVDLRALRVRSAVPMVVEVDDEWLASVAS